MTSPVGLERLHVLVVDDDTDLRETIAALLQEEGYLVSTASSGAQALGVLSPAPAPAPAVNVILFDLMMPESDGFDFRIKQRADDRIAHIPVIGMTGSMSLDPRIAELQTGGFLRKPFELGALVTLIEKLGRGAQ